MPADGFVSPPPRLHEPGIYLDLPMLDYVNDPALSGSSLKKLLTSAPDFKWELPALRNPLFTQAESDAQALGTLVHCALLEGMDAFHHRYFVAPELDDEDARVIRTAEHAKVWLKDHDQKCTGLKADLFERVRAYWQVLRLTEAQDEDEGPIFLDELCATLAAEGNGQRQKIKRRAFEYVALVERLVRSSKEANALLSHGLCEVSIFWTEGKIRYKARLDWLSAGAIVDVKKFGQPPERGRSLRTQLQREVVKYSYDIQAVHNSRATMQIPLLLEKSGAAVYATGADARERITRLEQIARAIIKEPPRFHWLFVRTPGPPQGLVMPFPADSRRWEHAEADVREAIMQLERYRQVCGDELNPEAPWIEFGVAEWDDDDLPEYMWELAR